MKDIRKVPPERLGTISKLQNGETLVQFIRLLPFSPTQVWRSITDAKELADWFPGLRLEHWQGGAFNIWFGGECEGPAHVCGVIDVFDPPRELRCGGMHWKLRAAPEGCHLTFSDVLRFNQDHRNDYEITNSVLAGWHFYMDQLQDALAGTLDRADTLEYDYSLVEIAQRPNNK